MTPKFDTVEAKTITATDKVGVEGGPSLTQQGIDAAGKKVTHVANGDVSATSKDAVNGSQLHETNVNIAKLGDRTNQLDNKVDRVNRDLKAGIAGAAAVAGLPQVRGNGKSMLAASASNYKGQNAVALGYSRASDNGKVLLKLSGSANSRGDVISTIGVGYEW